MHKVIYFLSLVVVSGLALAGEQVPFGDKVTDKVVNYHRHTPVIATSGVVKVGGLEEIKTLGFKTVLDLRTKPEGTDKEELAARKLGLTYHNLPVDKDWPSADTFLQFKRLVEDKENYPLLIHCQSANRVGMMWTYYRIQEGLDPELAVQEGRTIGMKPSREKQLREHMYH